ncbi:AsmA family protein [Arenimonas sp.]|uniref:AsmA family protein n=1 Tax=Arenimonas sp. TaxID=1872635 RepID=UPI0035B1799C
MTEPATAADSTSREVRHARGLLLAALVLLFLLVAGTPIAKALIEHQVRAATGREFSIGELSLSPGLVRHTVEGRDVRLGNADWATAPTLAEAGRVQIEWIPWRLLLGQVVITAVQLDQPVLSLERDADLRANWRFSDEPVQDPLPERFPEIETLWVRQGRLHLLEAQEKRRTDLSVDVQSGEPTAPGRLPPLLIEGGGDYRGNPFVIEGRIGSPLHLVDTDPDQRYWIDLSAEAGATRARASGGLRSVLQLQDFELDFSIAGADMAELYPLLRLAIPETAAYDLTGRLGRTDRTWHYREVTGTVGRSDLAGDVSVETGGERTRLVADLVSRKLDLDDLAGFIGGKPQAADPRDGRLFPDSVYDTEKLRSMDAQVSLVAHSLSAPPLPFESLDARLVLENGDLRLDPLDFGFAGGHIDGAVHLDARQDPMLADIDMKARGLQLPRMLPDAEAAKSQGSLGGQLRLQGRGSSVAGVMATASGEAGIAMGPGRISNYLMELVGLDIAEMIKFKLGKDKEVPVHCGYADFAVEGGVMTSRALAFDTSDTLVLGEGQVDLREERLDIVLRPRPKDFSPFSLRSPLQLSGPLADPDIRPQGGPLLLRGAAVAALYAIAPPAALLGLVETGPGGESDCGPKAD